MHGGGDSFILQVSKEDFMKEMIHGLSLKE